MSVHCVELLLDVNGKLHHPKRRGGGNHKAITNHLHNITLVLSSKVTNSLIVQLHGSTHLLWHIRSQLGTSHHIGEEDCNRIGWTFRGINGKVEMSLLQLRFTLLKSNLF